MTAPGHHELCDCRECVAAWLDTSAAVGSFGVEEMEREAAEARLPAARFVSRQVGCSDLGPLFVAYADTAGLPANIAAWIERARLRAKHGTKKNVPEEIRCVATWAALKSRLVRTPVGMLPEIVATKAGLRAKEAQASYAKGGEELEEKLLATWRRTLGDSDRIDPESIRTQHDVRRLYPAEWHGTLRMPNIRCPSLPELVTYGPDAWARTPFGDAIVINAKCSRDWKEEPDPPAWLQLQGEGMCCDALALLVLGQKWLADYVREPVEERAIRVWPVEEHAGTRLEIVRVVRRALAEIDAADAKFRETNEGRNAA